MDHSTRRNTCSTEHRSDAPKLLADGGEPADDESDEKEEAEEASELDRSNVEITEAGEAEPAEPQWEMPDIEESSRSGKQADDPPVAGGESVGGGEHRDESEQPDADVSGPETTEQGESGESKWEEPDLDELDDFEIRADDPAMVGGVGYRDVPGDDSENPTAGMPNTAGAPGTRIKEGSTEAFIAALELCARLPDEVRLPEEAAEIVPTAVEAELEDDIQSFASAEFDNQSPHIETLSFEEVDGEIWLRLRLGVSPSGFTDLDPEEIRHHALQELEGMF